MAPLDTKTGLCFIPYFHSGTLLFKYVVRFTILLNVLQLRLIACLKRCFCSSSKKLVAPVPDELQTERTKRIKSAQRLELLFIPFAFVFYLFTLLLFYPVILFMAVLRAIWRRCVIGLPSSFFKTNMQGPYGTCPECEHNTRRRMPRTWSHPCEHVCSQTHAR